MATPTRVLYISDNVQNFDLFVYKKYKSVNKSSAMHQMHHTLPDGTELNYLSVKWPSKTIENALVNVRFDTVYVDLPTGYEKELGEIWLIMPHHKFDYVGQSERWALPKLAGCQHEWVEYNSGWTSYEYCKNCNKERENV